MDNTSIISGLLSNTSMASANHRSTPTAAIPAAVVANANTLTPSKKALKKMQRMANKKASAAQAAAVIPQVATVAPTATTPAAAAAPNPLSVPDACVYFHSTKGCRYGEKCNMDHGSPPGKGSSAWNRCNQLQTKIGLTPTASFKQ